MSVSFGRKQIRKFFNGVRPAEIAFIDGVTAGTATASKALVLDSSKGIGTITSLTSTTLIGTTGTITTVNSTTTNGTTLNAGASGTAGTLNVFPTTASKGKVSLTASDATGNTTTTINVAAQATTRTYTVPDAGADATFVLTTSIGSNNTTRMTAQVDNAGTTLANLTGLTQTVQAGTYKFRAHLTTTAGGTGGFKLAFKYTTTVVSVLDATAYAYTATAIATAGTTTTTDQATIISSATAFTQIIVEGTMVVTTGGTIDLQFAENNANSTSSVKVGSTLNFSRIA